MMSFVYTIFFSLVAFVLTAFTAFRSRKKLRCRQIPGPKPLPLFGSLHLLGKYSNPFEAFTQLSKIYGQIFRMKLGISDCVVVNSFPLIKEVLVTKGAHFGARPDFLRYHVLFGGDRNNSMALCDWSVLQKKRRSIARLYCTPRYTTSNYEHLGRVGVEEIRHLMTELSQYEGSSLNIKPLLLAACGNMFTKYMCSLRFSYDDTEFTNIVRCFDELFYEINQGYAIDFLPWLKPFYMGHMKKLSNWANEIRQFILKRIIEEHRKTLERDEEPKDFTDALLLHLENDPELNWEHIIFELEDFLGGHSAVGNLVMLIIAAIVKDNNIANRIQEEVDAVVGNREITLNDRNNMPYTKAVILETLRTSSSPIVPHVASQDTAISGYPVEKGTVIFLNNYELNTCSSYWEKPEMFNPNRFISNSGSLVKPEYFIPFSSGKRTCIGQRLVEGFCFLLIANLSAKYNILTNNIEQVITYPASIALPPDTFHVILQPRTL